MTSGNSRVCFSLYICSVTLPIYLINRNLRDLPRKRCSCGPVIKCGLKNQNSPTSIKFTRTLKQQIFFLQDLKDNKWQSSAQSLNTYEKLLNTREEIEKKILAIYIPKNSRFQRKKMSLHINITTCLLCSNISSCC